MMYNAGMEKSLKSLINSVRQFRLLRSSPFIILFGSLLLIVNEYLFRVRFSVPSAIPYMFYWLIIAITFSALVLIPWQRYQQEKERLMVEAFMAGLIIGLAIAVYKILVYYQLWTLFNLLAEPIRTALFGLLVIWILREKNQTLAMSQITQ